MTDEKALKMDQELIIRLRKTRATMLGTLDEEHYGDCQEAAFLLEKKNKTIAELEAKNAEMLYRISKLRIFLSSLEGII